MPYFYRRVILTLLLVMVPATILTAALPARADTFDQIKKGFSGTGQAIGFLVNPDGSPKREFSAAFAQYATGLASIMAAFFLVLTIYGGWIWMTAQGNEERVQTGKMRIISGVIGLSIVIAARLIAELVIFYLSSTLPK